MNSRYTPRVPARDPIERRPSRALIVSGVGVLVAGGMKIVRLASLVALIFAAVSPAAMTDGLGLALIGTSVATLWFALRSSMPGIQSGAAGIVGAFVAVAVTDAVGVARPEAQDPTALVVVVVAGLATGALCLALGLTGAARMVRYVPHPVVAGVLAASGWLLTYSAMTMMTANVPGGVMDPAARGHWISGVATGVAMLVATRLIRHPLVVPATLTLVVIGFFSLAAWRGLSLADLSDAGWLFGPFPEGPLWRLPPADAFWAADWVAVLGQAPTIATVAIVSAMLTVLYTNVMELEHRLDMLPGRELRETGIGNLLGATFAGLPTLMTPAGTRLAHAMTARRRTDAVVAVLPVLAVLAFGGALLEALPRPMLGAILVYLGLDYFDEYLVSGFRRYGGFDLAVVLAIVSTVAVFGLFTGIGVGLALTVVMFVVASARGDVIGAARTGSSVRSRVTRAAMPREALYEHGDRTVIYHLEGTVFFGTADKLTEAVRSRLDTRPDTLSVVLDVRSAGAFDATGGMAVLRIVRAAERVGAEVVVVGAGPNVRDVMTRAGATVRFESDLDTALEHCENRLLDEIGVADVRPAFEDAIGDLPGGHATWRELRAWFHEIVVEPDQRVIEQGDDADDFWILAEGRITAVLERPDGTSFRLESLVPGQVIGELGFITHAPRSAHIVADEPSRLYKMDREGWSRLSEERPDLGVALRDLLLRLSAERVQHLSTALAASRS